MFQLSQAHDAVTKELRRLDVTTERCLEQVNRTFQELITLVQQRCQAMVESVQQTRLEKRQILEEQLALIESEKSKVCNLREIIVFKYINT